MTNERKEFILNNADVIRIGIERYGGFIATRDKLINRILLNALKGEGARAEWLRNQILHSLVYTPVGLCKDGEPLPNCKFDIAEIAFLFDNQKKIKIDKNREAFLLKNADIIRAEIESSGGFLAICDRLVNSVLSDALNEKGKFQKWLRSQIIDYGNPAFSVKELPDSMFYLSEVAFLFNERATGECEISNDIHHDDIAISGQIINAN